jgi:hypothetical protein
MADDDYLLVHSLKGFPQIIVNRHHCGGGTCAQTFSHVDEPVEGLSQKPVEAGFAETGIVLVGVVDNRPLAYLPPEKTDGERVEIVAMNKIRIKTLQDRECGQPKARQVEELPHADSIRRANRLDTKDADTGIKSFLWFHLRATIPANDRYAIS